VLAIFSVCELSEFSSSNRLQAFPKKLGAFLLWAVVRSDGGSIADHGNRVTVCSLNKRSDRNIEKSQVVNGTISCSCYLFSEFSSSSTPV
jgi:hypothetical protein